MCHAFVHFVLFRIEKERVLFSPLGGTSFSRWVETRNIPIPKDSIIVFDPQEQQVYFKGKAIIYILLRIGKFWKCIALLLQCLPLKIIDFCYDLVAKIRANLFKRPDDFCPIIPNKYRKFFEE
jgi:predicted DCC family thiol-disulfide oxidoreductase YuxK